jgi:diguanylate cyclase (GGDEF)-like protein
MARVNWPMETSMMPARKQASSVIDRATTDHALMARVSGVLYICGAWLVVISLALPHPMSVEEGMLSIIALTAAIFGGLLYRFSGRASPFAIHATLALASVLVSLCVYFSGAAAGIYSVMFVWVVTVAACVASRRALAVHVAWTLFTYGVAILALDGESLGWSPVTRFVLTGFALAASGAAVAWLVEGRRSAEAGLQREIETRKELQQELEHLANHDPLTGVANRRRLEDHLKRVLAEAARTGAPLCLISLDLDGFKDFNDKHGHAAGDRLLKSAASAWDSVLRTGDVITRMGGDEFLVVLPDCPYSVSTVVAKRLREPVPDGQSCSAGVTMWNGSDSADEFLLAADQELYRTKGKLNGTIAEEAA